MKNPVILAIALTALCLSCNRTPKYEQTYHVPDTEYTKAITELEDTTTARPDSDSTAMGTATTPPPVRSRSTYTPHYSPSSSDGDINEGGLRGFDPASEDDFEDNGMTRYMENTDEKGWL